MIGLDGLPALRLHRARTLDFEPDRAVPEDINEGLAQHLSGKRLGYRSTPPAPPSATAT